MHSEELISPVLEVLGVVVLFEKFLGFFEFSEEPLARDGVDEYFENVWMLLIMQKHFSVRCF